MNIQYRIQLVDLLKEKNIFGPAAEIGVAEGNFSRDLLAAGIPFLYMVDNWGTIENVKGDGNFPQEWHDSNYEKAMELVKPWAANVAVLRGLSYQQAANVPDNSLSLLYLDGDHSYDGVAKDLRAWNSKVIKGGIIAGHDYLNSAYGVKPAVDSFCKARGYKLHVIFENKPDDAGFYFYKS